MKDIKSKKILSEKLNLKVEEIKEGLSVGGSLYLRGTQITELPDNLSVGGSLDLGGTQITELPDNLSVGGSLDLGGTQITELPDNLSVGGSLYLDVKSFKSCLSYRENCGNNNRTIFSVFIGGQFNISAGCFFDGFDKFVAAVKNDYSGKSAENYIKKAQDCVNELTQKLSNKS